MSRGAARSEPQASEVDWSRVMSGRSTGRTTALVSVCAALALASCSTPVGVTHADPSAIQRELTRNVLNSGEPSLLSTQVLQRQDLYNRWLRDPPAALAALHGRLDATGSQYRLFALSELSYAYAQESGDRSHYLASAVYAYALLFPGDGESPPLGVADPRTRVACDLYNRALAEGLKSKDSSDVVIASGPRVLPFGVLDVQVESGGLHWAGYRMEQFVPAADLQVRGLRNRYRRAGIGAPLVARLAEGQVEEQAAEHRRVPDLVKVPITAFLRLDQPRANLASGWIAGRLELYSQDDVLDVDVDGREWPLEFETSSALAYMLGDSPWWDFELAGFLSGAFGPNAQRKGADDGLLLVHPYRPGRIPIVLVHGTASSPARWADLVNELEIDRVIWDNYQVWLYIYHTGNPIGYSGGRVPPGARERGAGARPRRHRRRAAPHGRDRAQPGGIAHQAHRGRKRGPLLEALERPADRRGAHERGDARRSCSAPRSSRRNRSSRA